MEPTTAWTTVMVGKGFGLGFVAKDVKGFMPTSAWFETEAEAQAMVDRMNHNDGVSDWQALAIVASSMNFRKRK